MVRETRGWHLLELFPNIWKQTVYGPFRSPSNSFQGILWVCQKSWEKAKNYLNVATKLCSPVILLHPPPKKCILKIEEKLKNMLLHFNFLSLQFLAESGWSCDCPHPHPSHKISAWHRISRRWSLPIFLITPTGSSKCKTSDHLNNFLYDNAPFVSSTKYKALLQQFKNGQS